MKEKILVIDDDDGVREITQIILQEKDTRFMKLTIMAAKESIRLSKIAPTLFY